MIAPGKILNVIPSKARSCAAHYSISGGTAEIPTTTPAFPAAGSNGPCPGSTAVAWCNPVKLSANPCLTLFQVPLSYDYAPLIPADRHYTLRSAVDELEQKGMKVRSAGLREH